MTAHWARDLLKRYRVTNSDDAKLAKFDPADKGGGLIDHGDIGDLLAKGIAALSDQQVRLYAAQYHSLLVVLQAMDAAGKDGTIAHVMTGINPQGVEVTSFKQPGPEDLQHGFLWRIHKAAPARGRIAIFNRSHYEDVLIARVHPAILSPLNLPAGRIGPKLWHHRLRDIVHFEKYLHHQGTLVLKFFLHVSKDEQKRRFLSRIDTPAKNWKFSAADIAERAFWDDYQDAYQEAIAATAAPHAPWFIIPADNKPFAHLLVAEAIVGALSDLDLKMPSPSPTELALLQKARKTLENE